MPNRTEKHCSFCGKGQSEVKKLIANVNGDFLICDRCLIASLETLASAEDEFAPDEQKAYRDMARQLRIRFYGSHLRKV